MKTFVVFLKSNLYDNESFKCIVTSIGTENILLAHQWVYPEVTFEIYKQIPIYDAFLFNYFINKIPQYKSAFVTVSFNDNLKYESCKIPDMVFTNEQYDLILEIIDYINKLTALLPIDNDTILSNSNNTEEDDNNFICKSSSVAKGDIVGYSELDEYDEIYPIHYNCTDLYFINNKFNEHSVKYIIMNKGFTFNGMFFTKLFPELDIQIFNNFPNIPLAEQMFEYQLNLYDTNNLPIKDIITSINDFLISKIQSVKVSEIKEPIEEPKDFNVHMKQFNAIKDFINSRCTTVEGTSTQSKVLFDSFVTFCQEHELPEMSHTKFSKLFKQASLYDTIRKSNGIYWINLELKV